MPRALRVKFPGGSTQAPITLLAGTGYFTRTGQAATLTKYSPPAVTDSWVRLQQVHTFGDVQAGPPQNQGWWDWAVHPVTGEMWSFYVNGTYVFNYQTGVWRYVTTNTSDWHRYLAFRENSGVTYGSATDTFWIGAGGPMGWGGTPISPVYGVIRYDVASDEFRNIYPASDATYSPVPADSGYWITANKGLAPPTFDARLFVYNGELYSLSPWTNSFAKINLTTNVRTTLQTCPGYQPAGETLGIGSRALGAALQRQGFDSRRKIAWVLADECVLWWYDMTKTSPAWEQVTTTGTKPSTTPPAGRRQTDTSWGLLAELDENTNQLVVWCNSAGTVTADAGEVTRKTWMLDWTTLQWRDGPQAATGATVPAGPTPAVGAVMRYNPVSKTVMLNNCVQSSFVSDVWEIRPGVSKVGKITAYSLPPKSGSTFGVNYYGFPYTSNGASKHTNMAYCPLDDRIYICSGDTSSSAVDATWSMSMTDGSWRLDSQRLYPNIPHPSGYQDQAGFAWSASRQKFIFWPGIIDGYVNSNVQEWAQGLWMYNPSTKVWTQDTTLFNQSYVSGAFMGIHDSTGFAFGGLYDDQTGIIYCVGAGTVKRYDVSTMTQLSTLTYTGGSTTNVSGYPTVVYPERTKHERIGRWIYFICGAGNGAQHKYALGKWNIDSNIFVWCAAPPAPVFNHPGGAEMFEQTLGVSRNYIVWPHRTGPDGEIVAIYVYDTINDTWQTDTQVPAYGNFIANSVCSLPDGRVAMSGGVFGRQQTHIWFYEVF